MNAPPAMPDSEGPENRRPRADAVRSMGHRIHSEIVDAFAHELNQPLAAILGNAQAARRFIAADIIERDELLAILDDIIRDTKRAGGMIRSLQAQDKEPRQQP